MALPTFRPRTRLVKLTHGKGDTEEVVEILLHPVPLAIRGVLNGMLADPPLYVNGVAKGTDPKQAPLAEERRAAAFIGIALRHTLTAQPPTESRAEAWIAYADAVQAEMEAAGFLSGDIQILFRELMLLHAGLGDDLKNASGASAAG